MAIDTIARSLIGLDLFRGLGPEHVVRIARDAERMIFRSGQRIIDAGKAGDGSIVIISGTARRMADPNDEYEDALPIEPGTLLGETAMLTEHIFSTTVIADGDVRAVKLTRDAMLALMREDALIAEHFHDRLAARLQRMAIELRMIDQRLAAAVECLEPSTVAAAG